MIAFGQLQDLFKNSVNNLYATGALTPVESSACNILGFYHWGSHEGKYLIIPKELTIDEFFVEGYALYFAEGDNGSNGKMRPRGVIKGLWREFYQRYLDDHWIIL